MSLPTISKLIAFFSKKSNLAIQICDSHIAVLQTSWHQQQIRFHQFVVMELNQSTGTEKYQGLQTAEISFKLAEIKKLLPLTSKEALTVVSSSQVMQQNMDFSQITTRQEAHAYASVLAGDWLNLPLDALQADHTWQAGKTSAWVVACAKVHVDLLVQIITALKWRLLLIDVEHFAYQRACRYLKISEELSQADKVEAHCSGITSLLSNSSVDESFNLEAAMQYNEQFLVCFGLALRRNRNKHDQY